MRLPLSALACFALVLVTRNAVAGFAIEDLRTNIHVGGISRAAIGWEFRPTVPIVVTKLGYYDRAQDGFYNEHLLALFEVPTQTILASEAIPAGTVAPLRGNPVRIDQGSNPLILGGYRYTTVEPVLLEPTRSYVIAADPRSYGGPEDVPEYTAGTTNVFKLAKEIEFIRYRETPNRIRFVFPDPTFRSSFVLGPTFEYRVVPEPSTLALAGGGSIVLLAFIARRRSARSIAGAIEAPLPF